MPDIPAKVCLSLPITERVCGAVSYGIIMTVLVCDHCTGPFLDSHAVNLIPICMYMTAWI